ncbi:MAG: ester cyclase [bacterium]
MKSLSLPIALLAIFCLASCAKKESPAMIAKARADSMETAYKAFMTAWDAGKVEEFDKYISPNCLDKYEMLPGMKSGLAGLKEMALMVKTGCPDNKTTIKSMYADSNVLNVAYTDTGMNTGPMGGYPASNEKMTGSGNYRVNWVNGKFEDLSGLMDGAKSRVSTRKMIEDFAHPEAKKN